MQTPDTTEELGKLLWLHEMAHSDSPQSKAAALRRWDSTTDSVRESWRNRARLLIQAHNKKMAGLVPELTYEVASGPPEWFEPLFASGMAKGFNEARRLILGDDA